MSDTIPILDLKPEIKEMRAELIQAFERVLDSTYFIGGPEVEAFSSELAEMFHCKNVLTLNSGTDALVIALRAAGIGPGDEVITSAFTFFATAEAISHVGATPVFVDIEPKTFNIDVTKIDRAITSKTRAIIPVHLFGQAADIKSVMEIAAKTKLVVIEDVAQAFGAECDGRLLGTIGDFGCYSFFPSKNLGGFGDGGFMISKDEKHAELSKMLAIHGAKKKYFNEIVGYNSRLDALQAALLRVKLKRIDSMNAGRIAAGERYNRMLSGLTQTIEIPYVKSGNKHVYHQYTVRIKNGKRDEVQTKMKAMGVETFVYYPKALHQLPVYSHIQCNLPETDAAAREVLSLPIWPSISEDTQRQVVSKLADSLG